MFERIDMHIEARAVSAAASIPGNEHHFIKRPLGLFAAAQADKKRLMKWRKEAYAGSFTQTVLRHPLFMPPFVHEALLVLMGADNAWNLENKGIDH